MAIHPIMLALKLVPLAFLAWQRITLGPIANFTSLPGIKTQQIGNSHGSAEVRESCSKFGWPIQAWVQIKLKRSRLFELAPQSPKSWYSFSLSTDLETGMPVFDGKFLIGSESQTFIRVLAARSDLRQHFALLPGRLNRFQATLVRVRAESCDLAVQCNVRWTKDRPALYRALLDWMQALDHLMASEAPLQSSETHVNKLPVTKGTYQ